MPIAIKKQCYFPSCPNTTTEGNYCEAHRQDRTKELKKLRFQKDKTLASREAFYTSPRWRNLRAMVLRRSPLCLMCGLAATEVDHIVPIRLGGAMMEEANLQTLCHSCHSRKTMLEIHAAREGGGG